MPSELLLCSRTRNTAVTWHLPHRAMIHRAITQVRCLCTRSGMFHVPLTSIFHKFQHIYDMQLQDEGPNPKNPACTDTGHTHKRCTTTHTNAHGTTIHTQLANLTTEV